MARVARADRDLGSGFVCKMKCTALKGLLGSTQGGKKYRSYRRH